MKTSIDSEDRFASKQLAHKGCPGWRKRVLYFGRRWSIQTLEERPVAPKEKDSFAIQGKHEGWI